MSFQNVPSVMYSFVSLLFVSNIINSGLYNSSNRDNEYIVKTLYSNANNETPNPSTLFDGEMAINIFKDNEKIFFKKHCFTIEVCIL